MRNMNLLSHYKPFLLLLAFGLSGCNFSAGFDYKNKKRVPSENKKILQQLSDEKENPN